jgi:serine/threonine protein kinase
MAAPELKQLGRYDLTRVLGKGAMGIVYEGMDPKLHRKVAIKTILKGHMDDDDAAKEYSMRFMREAQAVARLNHPHIVQVYDFGEEGEVAYIVMEFIKGKELKSFFDANERFELKEAVRIMCELLDALDFAHEGGIVHRDIKPANVMLDGQARVKLADFGVARVVDADRTQVERTQAGTMVGTPAYMSPEQITGGNIDRRTDVFSAGIILYQFLTGEKPFTGSGAWTIAKKIIQDHPPVPSSINNTISPLFDNVVNKALSKQVETRYQTAREFAQALKRALEGKSDEDESDKTVVGSMAVDLSSVAKPAAQMATARAESTKGATSTGSQEVELEFWRAIKDGNDPDDFELYVQQFPTGIYAALAKRKIAKLRGVAPEESGAKAREQEKREAEEAAKREAEVKQKLAEEKAKLEATLAQKEAEYKKREAEAEARRLAEAKARAEADAKREAEMAKREAEAKARAAAEEKARLEAIEKAKQEAAAELARREAEYKKREAEAKAKADAEAKARHEIEEKAKREAELRTKAEAEARAKREAEELARRQAEAKARAETEARAKKEAEEHAKREAEAAKREAELKKKLAEAPRAKMPVVPIIAALVVIALIGGGAYYYFTAEQRARQAELTARLETAAKASEDLKQAQTKQLEALKEVEARRAAEVAALKSGDAAKIKEAQEATKRAEAEAAKQAEQVKQREAAATKAREDAKKAADAAKQAAADKQKAEQKQEVAVAPKAPEAPKAEGQKAPEVAPKAAPKAEAPKVAEAHKPEPKSRSEREAARDEELARKALAAAEKKAPPVQVASAAPTSAAASSGATSSPGASAASAPAAPVSKAAEMEILYQQALADENGGKVKEAIRLYRRAARGGNGKAAKRLGEIYDKGIPGVSRDYAESLQWYETARQLGETIELSGKR